jgi:hypothetical protein
MPGAITEVSLIKAPGIIVGIPHSEARKVCHRPAVVVALAY